jgi:hypothetical protein
VVLEVPPELVAPPVDAVAPVVECVVPVELVAAVVPPPSSDPACNVAEHPASANNVQSIGLGMCTSPAND